MNRDKRVSIERLFDLQDHTFAWHLDRNKAAMSHLKTGIELCWNHQSYIVNDAIYDDDTYTTFLELYFESVSSITIIYRIGMWGAVTDAFALLRVAIEALGVLQYVIDNNEFTKLVAYRKKGQMPNDFIRASQRHDAGLQKVIDRLSNHGSHFSKARLKRQRFIVDGKAYGRAAFAAYNGNNHLASELNDVFNTVLYALWIVRDFAKDVKPDIFDQTLVQAVEQWEADLGKLRTASRKK